MYICYGYGKDGYGMERWNFEEVRTNIGDGVTGVKNAVDNAKGMMLRAKCDCGVRLTSAKQKKDVFNLGFNVDKEIPVLKLLGYVLAAAAALLALSAFLDSIFGHRCASTQDDARDD